ncbi:MAG: DedA family protein [Candidatus Absconditicoccaceae bacterium]
MKYLLGMIDFILNIDVHLQTLLSEYGMWLYGILFAIIFIETGLVLMPFLPGDSLLFVAGSLAGGGYLDIIPLLGILFIAAVAGDTVNYHIGKYFGHHMLKRKIGGRHIIKPEHIEKTKTFFDRHGKRTIILARFVPIVRTLAPFIAGIGNMSYRTFISYNMIGGFVWVVGITLVGYFFGQIPLVKNNFEKVVIGIILISLLPILIEYIKHKRSKKK